jgi:hypothetical protein
VHLAHAQPYGLTLLLDGKSPEKKINIRLGVQQGTSLSGSILVANQKLEKLHDHVAKMGFKDF